VDDTGKIVREVKVQALLAVLKNPAYHFKRIGVGSWAILQNPNRLRPARVLLFVLFKNATSCSGHRPD
jgi:hypothetical protein